ncbi:MAG: LppX_LprAFG lipoprotein [Chloroflexi bacterium]|nr:LppX_LprAFG lipoprotein [Chloroflexota bacterium]
MALVVSCGSGPAATIDPSLDVREVLRQSVERVLALESAEFVLEHELGSTELLPGIEMSKVYGVADIPDKFRFTVEAQVSNTFVETGVVVIGDQAYMTNFWTGQWQEVSKDILPLNLSNLGQTLAGIIESVQEPSLVGAERWHGYDAYRIRGMVKSNDLLVLVPNAGDGFDIDLELLVDREQGLLLQVMITGQMITSDALKTVRVLTLDAIDAPVEISVPITDPQ